MRCLLPFLLLCTSPLWLASHVGAQDCPERLSLTFRTALGSESDSCIEIGNQLDLASSYKLVCAVGNAVVVNINDANPATRITDVSSEAWAPPLCTNLYNDLSGSPFASCGYNTLTCLGNTGVSWTVTADTEGLPDGAVQPEDTTGGGSTGGDTGGVGGAGGGGDNGGGDSMGGGGGTSGSGSSSVFIPGPSGVPDDSAGGIGVPLLPSLFPELEPAVQFLSDVATLWTGLAPTFISETPLPVKAISSAQSLFDVMTHLGRVSCLWFEGVIDPLDDLRPPRSDVFEYCFEELDATELDEVVGGRILDGVSGFLADTLGISRRLRRLTSAERQLLGSHKRSRRSWDVEDRDMDDDSDERDDERSSAVGGHKDRRLLQGRRSTSPPEPPAGRSRGASGDGVFDICPFALPGVEISSSVGAITVKTTDAQRTAAEALNSKCSTSDMVAFIGKLLPADGGASRGASTGASIDAGCPLSGFTAPPLQKTLDVLEQVAIGLQASGVVVTAAAEVVQAAERELANAASDLQSARGTLQCSAASAADAAEVCSRAAVNVYATRCLPADCIV